MTSAKLSDFLTPLSAFGNEIQFRIHATSLIPAAQSVLHVCFRVSWTCQYTVDGSSSTRAEKGALGQYPELNPGTHLLCPPVLLVLPSTVYRQAVL